MGAIRCAGVCSLIECELGLVFHRFWRAKTGLGRPHFTPDLFFLFVTDLVKNGRAQMDSVVVKVYWSIALKIAKPD